MDAYATWCPPCKAAAPKYAQMSEQFTADSCVFAKFNTDEVGELAKKLEISAMPTFKVRVPMVTPSPMHAEPGQLTV